MSREPDRSASATLVDHWIAAERDYRSKGHDGSRRAGAVKICGDASSKMIFTAPHAVNHLRDGAVKNADIWTGSLAETLALATGNCSLTVNSSSDEDPNWDHGIGVFKATLVRLLRHDQFVIDLHGMKDDYGVDICIGLGRFPSPLSNSLANCFGDSFGKRGLRVSVNWPFPATRPSTITSFAQSRGLTALQIEVAAKYRQPGRHPSSAGVLLDGFLSTLTKLK